MTTPEREPEHGLRAPAKSFWRWDESGGVAVWADSRTIAFRNELAVVIRRLKLENLPPIGAILLVLAACRDNWHEAPSPLGILTGLANSAGSAFRKVIDIDRLGAELNRIASFDRDLLRSLDAKAELAAMVFEGRKGPAHDVERICNMLEHGLPEICLVPFDLPLGLDLSRDVVHLLPGLARVEERALRLRIRTGLDAEILPARLELPQSTTARGLIGQLQDDVELGGLARIAQRLLGILHLPIPLSQPEELPLGGVSDITNRGSLDRLLITELAQDNLTLAARLANNEALYLRREAPPHVPNRRRFVLLDSGIRMWGVPRVFATAVGLALAAEGEKRLPVDVYRAAGPGIVPVDMSSPAGLVAHLATLDHRAHPGAALLELAEACQQTPEATDVVIVTTDDVLADAAFQRCLAEAGLPEIYLASVGRDGRLAIHLQNKAGRKPLYRATLDLDELLRPRARPSAPLIAADGRTELPAIFGSRAFPLRLSAAIEDARSWHVKDFGVVTYARDGRLLHWDNSQRGARQLAEDLPVGGLHYASTFMGSDDTVQAIIGSLGNGNLYSLAITANGDCRLVELEASQLQKSAVFVRGGIIFVRTPTRVFAYHPHTGKEVASVELAVRTHERGSFFSQFHSHFHRQWFRIGFDGLKIRWEALYTPTAGRDALIAVIEQHPGETALGVTPYGSLVNFETDEHRNFSHPFAPGPFRFLAASRDGRRIMLEPRQGGKTFIVDVQTLAAEPRGKASDKFLEPALFASAHPVVMRHRFRSIGIDNKSRLVLVGRNGLCWPLNFAQMSGKLCLPKEPEQVGPLTPSAFEPLAHKRYELSKAVLGDGSMAILDSRGLLHLKSAEPKIPQCSIVLTPGATAGWTSDGRFWGSEYFIGDHLRTLDRAIYDDILRPFVEHLP